MMIQLSNREQKSVSFTDFLCFFGRKADESNHEIIKKLVYPPKNRRILHQLAEDDKLCLLMQVINQNKEIDLNATDDENSTALIIALKNKHLPLARYLIRNH